MAKDTTAKQRDCRRTCWGAIAIANRGAAFGTWINAPSQSRAKTQAKRQCRIASSYPRTCRWRVTTVNSCAASAVRMRNGWVARVRSAYDKNTRRAAVRTALNKCERDGGNCIRRGWICTAHARY